MKTCEWVGSKDGSLDDQNNWKDNLLPESGDRVVFKGNLPKGVIRVGVGQVVFIPTANVSVKYETANAS